MIRSRKIQLDPNNVQITHLKKACGVARFAYNWALARWKELHEDGKKPNEGMLRKELASIKREQFPWMLEVTKCSPEQSVKNVGKAFKNFFSKTGKYPKFKKKGVRDSFYIDNEKFRVENKYAILPKLGRVRMTERLRLDGKIMSAVVSQRVGKWFVSIAVELSDPIVPMRENQAVGIDMGITDLAVLSNGERYAGTKALKNNLKRLRMFNKSLSRKQKGSGRWKIAKTKLSKLHYRISNIRNDYWHKLTTDICKRFTHIGIEDLAVSNMVKNRKLAKHIQDMGWGEGRRQLEYKAPVYGSEIIVNDRFYASSKTCKGCGFVLQELKLSVREWDCPSCGRHNDRDLNAAQNLEPNLAAG